MYMLIDYDQKGGRLISYRTFGESERDAARKARLDLELQLHAAGEMREVVILRAVDEAQIRRTHRRYFETLDQLLAPDTLERYERAPTKQKSKTI